MKKYSLFLCVIFFLYSTASFAGPYMPPNGELIFQFSGLEQISQNNQIQTEDSDGNTVSEGTWGIIRMTDISTPFSGDNPLWNRGDGDGEIVGIFAGAQTIENPSQGSNLQSTDGSIHLYWNEDTTNVPSLDPTVSTPDLRTGQFEYPIFTEGTLLAQIDFINGAFKDNNDPDASITGSSAPSLGGTFAGDANAFGNIGDYNNDGAIDSSDGAWANLLQSAYFDTDLGPNTADIDFSNSYDNNSYSDGAHPWNGDEDTDIVGADYTDPALANAVPEPGTLLLFGTGLLGLAAFGRRKFIQKS